MFQVIEIVLFYSDSTYENQNDLMKTSRNWPIKRLDHLEAKKVRMRGMGFSLA